MAITMVSEDLGFMEGVSSANGAALGNTLIDTGLNNYIVPGLLGSTVVLHPTNPLRRDVMRVVAGGGGTLAFSEPYRLGIIAAGTPYILLISRSADFDAEKASRNVGSFAANTFLKTLAQCIGDPTLPLATDIVTLKLAAVAAALADSKRAEHVAQKLDCNCLTATDDLFTVAGGPILVTELFGYVTVQTGIAGALNIEHVVTAPGATIDLSTAVAFTTIAIGTSVYFTDAALAVLTPVAAGTIPKPTQMLPWILTPGTLRAAFVTGGAGIVGNIEWFMVYKTGPGVTVTAV